MSYIYLKNHVEKKYKNYYKSYAEYQFDKLTCLITFPTFSYIPIHNLRIKCCCFLIEIASSVTYFLGECKKKCLIISEWHLQDGEMFFMDLCFGIEFYIKRIIHESYMKGCGFLKFAVEFTCTISVCSAYLTMETFKS